MSEKLIKITGQVRDIKPIVELENGDHLLEFSVLEIYSKSLADGKEWIKKKKLHWVKAYNRKADKLINKIKEGSKVNLKGVLKLPFHREIPIQQLAYTRMTVSSVRLH